MSERRFTVYAKAPGWPWILADVGTDAAFRAGAAVAFGLMGMFEAIARNERRKAHYARTQRFIRTRS